MEELVAYIAKALVDRPDEVRVTQLEGTRAGVLELRVARDDMGRIIGREGRIINAIPVLLRVSAAREGTRVTLEIV